MEKRPFCNVCQVNFNCKDQWLDHFQNRMHQNILAEAILESCSTAAPSEAEHFTFDRETHLHMLRVSTSIELAAMGKAAQLIQRAFRKHSNERVGLAAP